MDITDYLRDVTPITLTVTVAVGILTILLVLLWTVCFKSGGRGKTGRTILILGTTGSGKTVLFYRMLFGTRVNTQTSMKPNIAKSTLNGDDSEEGETNTSEYHFVDVPGHPRIRRQMVKKYSPLVGAIIFVVDGTRSDVRSSAEYLYDILTDPIIDDKTPPMLILSNKSDCKYAKESKDLKRCLEEELTKLKETRASLAQTGGGSDTSDEPLALGLKDEDFTFVRHSPCEVTFATGSALDGKLSAAVSFVRESIQ